MRTSQGSAVLYDAERRVWLSFTHPRWVLATNEAGRVAAALRTAATSAEAHGLWAVGFCSYESAAGFDAALRTREDPGDFPLVWFGLFGAPEVSTELPSKNTSEEAVDLAEGAAVRSEQSSLDLEWVPSVSPSEYRNAIRRIKELIRAGDTYQVNYSFRLHASGVSDPYRLFLQMVRAQGPGYAAFLHTGRWSICSASPELFFSLQDGHIVSRPMKGTAPRGLWYRQDLDQAAELQASLKDQAENIMIVDMVRNDLGRIAETGTVSVPKLLELEKYPTVWQLTSTVEARTSASIPETFAALFPPASITGAPKARTMEIIAELESSPRRIYTGSIGFITPNGRAQFNVAIRTALVDETSSAAEYGVGGGIVWGSQSAPELAECLTKARVLTRTRPNFDLFETILWLPERVGRRGTEGYVLLDRHLRRLADSAEYFSRPCDAGKIRARLAALAGTLPRCPHKVRLFLSPDGDLRLDHQQIEPAPPGLLRVCAAAEPVDSSDVFLYHKTTHRDTYDRAYAACRGPRRCATPHADFHDVILRNERGEVTESTRANVVVSLGAELLTPPLSCGLLPGTYRAFLLDSGVVQEAVLTLESLRSADAVFLVNSVRGMYAVEFEMPGRYSRDQ